MAVKANLLLAMKKEEGREFIAGKRLVYVYHDEIDARGDKAATEEDTFEAVRKTIREIAELVRYVVNNLNGNYVVITADHGFSVHRIGAGRSGQEQAGGQARRHGHREETIPPGLRSAASRPGMAG